MSSERQALRSLPVAPAPERSSRRGWLRQCLLFGAVAGGLAACGRSSMVRYADGRRYRGGDIPNTEANVPSSSGASTY